MKIRYRILMLLLMFLLMGKVNAAELLHGETKNEDINIGSIDKEGDVLVNSNLIKLDDKGNYRVKYTIKSNDAVRKITDSMNIALLIDADKDVGNNKWNDMINGVKDFSKKVLSYNNEAKIGLFKFNKRTSLLRKFDNENLDKVRFGNLDKGKNIKDALSTVMQYYNRSDENTLNYVILISDGNYTDNDIIEISNKMKDKGIKIYTIHYNDTLSEDNILESIASSDSHYGANRNELITVLDKINNNIFTIDAGKEFKFNAEIGESYDYVTGTEGVTFKDGIISYNTSKLNDNTISFSYDIKMRDDLDTNWYSVNKNAMVQYKDYLEEDKELIFTEFPMVYFISDLYNYTINYYKNTVNELNYLGKYMGKVNKNSYIELDDSLYIPDDYQYNGEENLLIDEENKIINVVYEIKTMPPKTGDSNNNIYLLGGILLILGKLIKLR